MGSIAIILGLFIIGILLIALEAFVIPGFGLPGLIGGAIVVYAALQAWTEHDPVWGITLGGLALLISIAFLVWVPNSRMGKRFTLKTSITETTAYDAEAKRAGVAIGHKGVTSTHLRPSGFALFGEERVEVRTVGEYVASDQPIIVTNFKNGKVFVEAVSSDDEPSSS